LQIRVRCDHALTPPREFAALFESNGDRLQPEPDRFQRSKANRRIVDRPHELLLQLMRTLKQHFALVGKVSKERSLGDARALGDLLDRRLLESALAVQFQRRLSKPAARIRFPSPQSLYNT
jgi:hypothetical protein